MLRISWDIQRISYDIIITSWDLLKTSRDALRTSWDIIRTFFRERLHTSEGVVSRLVMSMICIKISGFFSPEMLGKKILLFDKDADYPTTEGNNTGRCCTELYPRETRTI